MGCQKDGRGHLRHVGEALVCQRNGTRGGNGAADECGGGGGSEERLPNHSLPKWRGKALRGHAHAQTGFRRSKGGNEDSLAGLVLSG